MHHTQARLAITAFKDAMRDGGKFTLSDLDRAIIAHKHKLTAEDTLRLSKIAAGEFIHELSGEDKEILDLKKEISLLEFRQYLDEGKVRDPRVPEEQPDVNGEEVAKS